MKYIPSWVPGAHFQRLAEEARDLHTRMRDGPVEVTKMELVGNLLYHHP